MKGWTQRVHIETPDGDLEGVIALDTDIDGEFVIETDDGKFKVNGWLVEVEYL